MFPHYRSEPTRTGGRTQLVIPDFDNVLITVARKGFDSTASKLTAAVTQIQAMAHVQPAHQYVLAVVDGIGRNERPGDFRRMFALSESTGIDGLYTLYDPSSSARTW